MVSVEQTRKIPLTRMFTSGGVIYSDVAVVVSRLGSQSKEIIIFDCFRNTFDVRLFP